MAIAGIFPTSLGEAQRAEKMHRRALSTCCATEVSKQSIHSDANRLGLVIGNSSYPDADVPPTQTVNDASALASALRKDGLDIYLVQNATRDDMTRAIARPTIRHQRRVIRCSSYPRKADRGISHCLVSLRLKSCRVFRGSPDPEFLNFVRYSYGISFDDFAVFQKFVVPNIALQKTRTSSSLSVAL